MKTYSDLILLPDYFSRLQYLQIKSNIGFQTFGDARWMNQDLYRTNKFWKNARNIAIVRDNGCDLGIKGLEIIGHIYVHHIEPLTEEDILEMRPCVFDPDNLISTSFETHNKIHFGVSVDLQAPPPERYEFDTCPWRLQ